MSSINTKAKVIKQCLNLTLQIDNSVILSSMVQEWEEGQNVSLIESMVGNGMKYHCDWSYKNPK